MQTINLRTDDDNLQIRDPEKYNFHFEIGMWGVIYVRLHCVIDSESHLQV